jgi:hypothetical protein
MITVHRHTSIKLCGVMRQYSGVHYLKYSVWSSGHPGVCVAYVINLHRQNCMCTVFSTVSYQFLVLRWYRKTTSSQFVAILWSAAQLPAKMLQLMLYDIFCDVSFQKPTFSPVQTE